MKISILIAFIAFILIAILIPAILWHLEWLMFGVFIASGVMTIISITYYAWKSKGGK